ncbi:MAG: GIY-YIG nuclease family protein, partial [Bacteroidota bacterium]|nr:GIY-YIG nuclease family protein [Bacteroidota bacterium]
MLKTKIISELLALIPKSTGVYLFYNQNQTLLYVGKAKNLNSRVKSYFNNSIVCKKTKSLVKQIYDIKYTVVFSETDALLLENNLIKKHQPKYNIMLKDDKTYPWICIKNESIPRVFQTRKVVKDGSEYYGPFMSTRIIDILLNVFSDLFYNSGWTPFSYLNRELNKKSRKEYLANISKIRKILKGNITLVVNSLKKDMFMCSKNLEFEKAQKIKEAISLIKQYQSKSTIVNTKI